MTAISLDGQTVTVSGRWSLCAPVIWRMDDGRYAHVKSVELHSHAIRLERIDCSSPRKVWFRQ